MNMSYINENKLYKTIYYLIYIKNGVNYEVEVIRLFGNFFISFF